MAHKKAERNTFGRDADAPIASMNEIYDLCDELQELWDEKFEQMKEEREPWKSSQIGYELGGISDAKGVVLKFMFRMERRMTMME